MGSSINEDPSIPTEPTPTPDPVPTPIPDPNPGPNPIPTPGDGSGENLAQVIDALTIGTVETIANSASFAMANLYQHQINHARRLDSMAEACLGKMLKRMSSTSPEESIATAKLFQGEADSSISSLLAQLDAGQIGAKIAQSTPGDLAMEIAKVSASIASVNGLIGGLVALLQVMLKNENGIPVQNLSRSRPMPTPVPAPVPVNSPDNDEEIPNFPPNYRFPTVTIKY